MAEPETEVTETPKVETPSTEPEVQAPKIGETETPEASDEDDISKIPELGKDDVAQLLEEDDDDEVEEAETTAESPELESTLEPEGKPPVEKPAEKPAEEPAKEPAAEKPEGVKPAETPTKEPATEPIPVPTETKPKEALAETPPAEPEPILTPEEQTKAYETWRGEVEGKLATARYAISEEEAQELDITPEFATVISKYSARVYMDAVTGAIGHITTAMPQLLASAMLNNTAQAKAQEKFYTTWPLLNDAAHGAAVARIGHAYRQLNPTVDTETFIREVGGQAMVALRIAPSTPAGAETSAVTEPEVPLKPFQPAGSVAPGGSPTIQKNIYDTMTEDFDADDAAEGD